MPGKAIFDIGWAASYKVVTNGFELCPSHGQLVIMTIAMAPITCTITHKFLSFFLEWNECVRCTQLAFKCTYFSLWLRSASTSQRWQCNEHFLKKPTYRSGCVCWLVTLKNFIFIWMHFSCAFKWSCETIRLMKMEPPFLFLSMPMENLKILKLKYIVCDSTVFIG